jgi:hypothetical protein
VYIALLCTYVFRKSNTSLELVAVHFLWFGLSLFFLLTSCFCKIFDFGLKFCYDFNMVKRVDDVSSILFIRECESLVIANFKPGL